MAIGAKQRRGLPPFLVGLALALAAPAARADAPATSAPESRGGLADALPSDAALDGDEIYRRVLRNRLRSYVEESILTSGSRGGSEQQSRLITTWKSFRDGRESAVPENGVLSKTMVLYTEPFDLRDAGYLIIHHDTRPSDQFVYLPSFRRVRRVNLRGQAIFGTDFSFEDVVPREFENSTHQRVKDDRVAEAPCFVLELIPKPELQSEYSKLWVYVEKQRYVPLRTRYWSTDGAEVKELLVDPASIRDFEGVHIPMLASIRNLRLGTYTGIRIERLEANPELSDGSFDLRRLLRH